MDTKLKILAVVGVSTAAVLALVLVLTLTRPSCKLVDQVPRDTFTKSPVISSDNSAVAQARGFIQFQPTPANGAKPQYLAFESSSVSQDADELTIEAGCATIQLTLSSSSSRQQLIGSSMSIKFRNYPSRAPSGCSLNSLVGIKSAAEKHYRCISTKSYTCEADPGASYQVTVYLTMLEFEIGSRQDDVAKYHDYSYLATDCA